jgi:tRNA 2-thiouridine synthesizing protein A
LSEPAHSEEWDAGAMGCGELVLELRFRMAPLQPGAVMLLTALDPGAREDIPAWCGMTRHRLVRAEHPRYWIARRED